MFISKRNEPKFAKQDIICYKFLIKKKEGFFTPYRYNIVKIGKLLEDSKSVTMDEGEFFRGNKYQLKGGVFHSYKHIESAVEDIEWFKEESYYKSCQFHIFKCIIPKGTCYYEGIDSAGDECYASRKIIIKEEIKND